MQSPSITYYKEPQENFNDLLSTIQLLYKRCVPKSVKNRKNIHLAIQPDEVILTCMIWGIIQNHPTQIATYRAVRSLFFRENFPSRTRYSRTSANLAQTMKCMRVLLTKQNVQNENFAIVDSLPIPLCRPVRNLRAKSLRPLANIGFNAVKKLHFFGFKFHALVSEDGYLFTYVVSSASHSDISLIHDLVEQFPCEFIIGDKGYISQALKEELQGMNISLSTALRKNMKSANKVNDYLLSKRRKKIETVFSSLERLGIGEFQNRSLQGFESKLESILFTYTYLLSRAQKISPNTLRYSLGY